MQTIKIIDLLNLVYEGKAPKFVIYDNNKYEYDLEVNDYKVIDESYLFTTLFEREANALSKTVEILEDKPRSIDEWGEIPLKELEKNLSLEELQTFVRVCINTQQELIRAVNYLSEKSDK